MKNFFNSRSAIVDDSINGLLAVAGNRLARFPEGHSARVVVRQDWQKDKVAIVSGGGSGHEPAHAGFVGAGMLTAAVCGDLFASPSVDAVLAAIQHVTGEAGCLIVIKNYTGDRLNFGLAAEKAKAMGLKVETIVVADDIAIADSVQPRGLAGSLFVHKLAGYLADQGHDLSSIHAKVNAANKTIMSLGVARDSCTMPGNDRDSRLDPDQVEVGLGIHGEPGVDVAKFDSAAQLTKEISARMESKLNDPAARYAMLFNNLGGLSELECAVLMAEFIKSPLSRRIDLVAGPALLVTALDMPGFSLSLIPLDETLRKALHHPVDVLAWSAVHEPVRTVPTVEPPATHQSKFEASSNTLVSQILKTLSEQCLTMEADINDLDAKVGDGDTGSTFAGAARALLKEIDTFPLNEGAQLFAALSDIKRRSMGGSSGVLFAIFFEAAAKQYRSKPDWFLSLWSGLEAMKFHGGALKGDRTMIDALEPALSGLIHGGSLSEAADAARMGANATAEMVSAGAGRSSYLDERSLSGVTDPGAEAIARLFESLVPSEVVES